VIAAEARRLTDRGDTLALIGRAGHAVTAGLVDQAPAAAVLVQSPEDVMGLRVRDPDRVSFLLAPGTPVEDAAPVVDALRTRFQRVVPQRPTTLCYAATDRREAVRGMAATSEVVLVAGSDRCADTAWLVAEANACCGAVHIVEEIGDIRPQWLAQAAVVGLSAAVSARPGLVEGIIAALSGLGPLAVAERTVRTAPLPAAPPRLMLNTSAPYPTPRAAVYQDPDPFQ
jgi:4-hydroxy-3-methylbut-2-enyl diphosphate reductase